MQARSLKRKPRLTYANVVSTLALVAALGTGSAFAVKGDLISSKEIQNGAVRSVDIHRSAVKSSDIGKNAVASADLKTNAVQSTDLATGAVQTADIGEGQVQPQDVTMPAPKQLEAGDAVSANLGSTFALLDSVGTYVKEDPTSVLQVDWSGTVQAGVSPCVFQVRIDGSPSTANAGELYVANGSTLSVSASTVFTGLGAGSHTIEVWAKATTGGETQYPCTVSPSHAGISQTFVVSERVV